MIAILLGFALVGVCVALFWPRGPKEPEYQGKKLSEWVTFHSHGSKVAPNNPDFAASAIRNIGTNAVPWLVRWIAYEPPPWARQAGWIFVRFPDAPFSKGISAAKIPFGW